MSNLTPGPTGGGVGDVEGSTAGMKMEKKKKSEPEVKPEESKWRNS